MNNELNELKPCPFCGEMPETDGRLVQCYLMPCDARHMKLPIKSWNTRPIEDALNARIAELEAFIQRLIETGDGLTINPSVSDYEQREAEWNKLWLEWKKEREE